MKVSWISKLTSANYCDHPLTTLASDMFMLLLLVRDNIMKSITGQTTRAAPEPLPKAKTCEQKQTRKANNSEKYRVQSLTSYVSIGDNEIRK